MDCQWVDITEMNTGSYTLKIAINPEFKVAEMNFDNNAAICNLLYTDTYARVDNCRLVRPWEGHGCDGPSRQGRDDHYELNHKQIMQL